MYTLIEIASEFNDLDEKSKDLVRHLLGSINPVSQSEIIPAGTDLNSLLSGQLEFFQIKEGSLTYQLNEKLLFVLNEGDLVGLEVCLGNSNAIISSEFAVIVDRFRVDDLRERCCRDNETNKKFNTYQTVQFQMMTYLIRELLKSDILLSPQIKNFSPGSTIIEQNTNAAEVYTLIEGSAEAFVDGVKVGDILRDEIFGMIAAITGTPRTATVKAATNCIVLAVPNEKFLSLINNKPQMVLKLLEDMSRMIVDLNKQVVGLNAFK